MNGRVKIDHADLHRAMQHKTGMSAADMGDGQEKYINLQIKILQVFLSKGSPTPVEKAFAERMIEEYKLIKMQNGFI